MILDRLLGVLSLLAFVGFVGTVLWFVPELDLMIIAVIVICIAAYFLLFARGDST